jgi:uncharacterized membrane protein
MSASDFFTAEQKEAIRAVIAEAEKQTSGEIRVHIENKCAGDAVECATGHFARLKMHETKDRNGILFYLAVQTRVFAIYGDTGINAKVPAGFWDEISTEMQAQFKEGLFTEGLVGGIKKAGEQLVQYFPVHPEDKNELTDDISFQ